MKKLIAALLFALASASPALAAPCGPIPALPDTVRRTEYTGIVAQTGPFNVNFQLYGDSTDYGNWLSVWVNGIIKTAVTDYTVTSPSGALGSLCLPITDAQVTFVVPQTGTIEIEGGQRPRRLSEFSENAGVTAHALNQVFNTMTAQLRERWDRESRLLRTPPGDSLTVLPLATARAGGLLGFDGAGNPIVTNTSGLPISPQTANKVFAGPPSAGPSAPTFRFLVAADLPLFSSTLNGAVSASGGGTANFLRADGTWQPVLSQSISPTVTGNWTFNPASGDALTITPAAASTARGFSITQSGPTSGSTTATTGTNCTGGNPFLAYNYACVDSEGANLVTGSPPFYTFAGDFGLVTGGANSTGSKIALQALLFKSAASTPSVSRDHIALNALCTIAGGDGGTGVTVGTAKGDCFAAGFVSTAQATATNLFIVSSFEADTGIATGGSAFLRFGGSFVSTGQVKGSGFDAAVEVGATVTGWGTGLMFSKQHGAASVATTGTVFGTDGQATTVTNYSDFSAWTFTGNLFNFTNFQVTAAGAATLGNLTLNGGATPQVLFQPSSGATKTGQVFQQGDVLRIGTAGVGEWVRVDLVAGNTVIVSGTLTITNLATDATHTDRTVCQDTTSKTLFFGSGAAGICLGTSSQRFKHDIAPLKVGLDQIERLQAVSYKLNADHGDPNKILYGFTAEQGGSILPDLAGRDQNGDMQTFDYMGVVPVLVRAVQQLKSDNDSLHKQLNEIGGRIP